MPTHYALAKQALAAATELIRLRRTAADWALLGYCEQSLGHADAALAAFEKSVEINPRLLPIHRELIRLYQDRGDSDKADRQRRIGERLRQLTKDSNTAN